MCREEGSAHRHACIRKGAHTKMEVQVLRISDYGNGMLITSTVRTAAD